MPLRVTLIQGGGIGFDIVPAVQEILAASGVDVVFDEFLAGGEAAMLSFQAATKLHLLWLATALAIACGLLVGSDLDPPGLDSA